MSLDNIQQYNFVNSLDGLTSLDVDVLTVDGKNIDLSNLVPYENADKALNMGSQNIQTTHIAVIGPDVVNKTHLDNVVNNLSVAISGSFLDKVTLTPQTVIGDVSYTATLSADNLVVPSTKTADIAGVVQVDVNYQQSTNDASVSANQYFGTITSSIGIYQSTSTQDMGVLGLGPALTVGKRYRVVINALVNDPSATNLTLYGSSNGTAFNQALQSIGFNPNSTIFKVFDHTFTAGFPYVILVCFTSGGGATVQWFGLQRYEVGVELENITLPALTSSQIPIINDKKQLVASGVSSSKVQYLDNVSSDIQTQLNSKLNLSGNNANQDIVLGGYKVQSTANPTVADDLTRKGYVDSIASNLLTSDNTWTGINTFSRGTSPIVLSGLTGNRLLGLGVAKDIQTINATLLEGSYLAGVTSGIQGQLDGKGNQATTNTWTSTNTFSAVNPINLSFLSGQRALILDASKNIQVSATTSTELGYVSGVTSGIQGQLNTLSGTFANYLPLTGGTISGDLVVNGANGIGLGSTAVTSGYGGPRYYLSGRGDNQDDVGNDNKFGPWYGLGASGIPNFTGVPCLAGYSGLALRTGSNFMIMNDSGNIGIGTTSVLGRCHIANAGGTEFLVLNNRNYTTTDYINQQFRFGSTGTVRSAYIQGYLTSNNETELKFFVSNSTGGVTERLRISGSGVTDCFGQLTVNGVAQTQNLVITNGYNINVSNGNGTDGQIMFGYSGTQSEYRHRITTGHDGGVGIGNPNNRMDFYLWGNNDAIKAVGSNLKMTINGQSTSVYARPLNVAGGYPYAVPQGFSNQAGQLVIGSIDQNYVGGWSSGFLMECQDRTELAVHDAGERVASFMYYNANTFAIGRDTGWGVSSTNIEGNLQCNGGTIIFPNRGDCRIYNGSADAYTPTSTANNLIVKSWWGIGYESYDGGVRIAMDTRTGNGYYAGFVGIGTTSPTARLHVYGDVDGGLVSYVQNNSAGGNAFALFACIANTDTGGLVLFQNSKNRSADGGVRTGTLRNDGGALRLQSQGGNGMTVNVGGSVSLSGGDSSITGYGPNSTWGAYLRVGAGTNGVSANTAQVLSTNGNLHLDGGNGKDIYIGYYPWTAGGGNPNNIYSYSRDTWTHNGNFNVTGNTTISLTTPSQTTWNSTDNRLLFRDSSTGIVRSGACSTWFYINGGIAWTYGVNTDYAFYVPNTTCSIQINVTGSGYSGNVIGTYLYVKVYSMFTGTSYDFAKAYFFNVTYNHTEITAHFLIPNNAWGANTIGWKRIEFYWLYNSGGSINSDSNDSLNWTALVIG